MKKIWMTAVICAAVMGGCKSASVSTPAGTVTADGTVIRANQVPLSVMSAFDAEHPYAKMTQAEQKDSGDGMMDYTIEYLRPDGSGGKVVYAQNGAMVRDGD